MYLNVDFERLYAAVRRMGADSVDPDLVVRREMSQIDPIDIQLEEGIEVDLSEVGVTDNGLFIYRGRQVLLYIQDHGGRVQDVLDNRRFRKTSSTLLIVEPWRTCAAGGGMNATSRRMT